jgi:hypothetical protein
MIARRASTEAHAGVLQSKVLHPAPLGALTQLYVATGAEAANATGKVRALAAYG